MTKPARPRNRMAKTPRFASPKVLTLCAALAAMAPSGPALAQTAGPAPNPTVAAPAANSMEAFNLWADHFNQSLADWVIAPTLKVYRGLPDPVPAMGRNAYQNLTEPVNALSRAMSSDPTGAVVSTSRFVINSTVGLLGTLDVANAIGLEPKRSYFAAGVCDVGVPIGPYLVLPGVGDTTVGVAATAMLAMAGSTMALGVISFELAMASVGVDVIATASALENMAGGHKTPLEARRAAYEKWLASEGCPPS